MSRERPDYVERVLDAAIAGASRRSLDPAMRWHNADVDSWTRDEFAARIRQDQRDGRTGSKTSIAHRVSMSPTALWRRWEAVRLDGERWPSGKKGPADRRGPEADQ